MAYNDIDSGKVLNKEGLLELCSQIKTEIANNSGGGSSYTAGAGIDIDANNVISKAPSAVSLLGMLYAIEANNTNIYNSNVWINNFIGTTTITNAAAKAKHIQNLKTFGMTYFTQGFTGDNQATNLKEIIHAVGGEDTTTSLPIISTAAYMNDQYTISLGGQTFTYSYMDLLGFMNVPVLVIFNGNESVGSNTRWWFIKNPEKVFQNKYFNSVKGLTSHSIPQAIDELATRIPTAPSTDGTYKLISTVASGTPTYSWDTDSGGGGGTTYTAGTGISIVNGVISLDLATAEEGEF